MYFDCVVGLLVCVCASLALVFIENNISEYVFSFSDTYQSSLVDELLFSSLLLILFIGVFAYRRCKETSDLSKQIDALINLDGVTQLPNRTFAYERLNGMLANAKKHKQQIAVLYIDFDRFKMVNDTYGHANGDLLIKSVGERISKVLSAQGTLLRLGGDEFLIFLKLNHSINPLNKLLIDLTQVQSAPYQVGSWEAYISYSIGVSIYPKDGSTADELLMAADTAMYKAKDNGDGLFHFYSKAIGKELSDRYQLEVGLKKAMVEQELRIVFQPILEVRSRTTKSYEALLRWDFRGQAVSPELIIEIAEQLQFINELGNWVLIKALQEAKQNLPKNSCIAVNISPIQFKQVNFVQNITNALARENFAPSKLIIEITESALLKDYEEARGKLSALRAKGIQIAIDDFGTGHSSLDRISELAVDTLKIDKSFVLKMLENKKNFKVINAIVALAKQLDISITAEGVETQEQMNLLFKFECDHLQGFYIGRPESSAQIFEQL